MKNKEQTKYELQYVILRNPTVEVLRLATKIISSKVKGIGQNKYREVIGLFSPELVVTDHGVANAND